MINDIMESHLNFVRQDDLSLAAPPAALAWRIEETCFNAKQIIAGFPRVSDALVSP